jgi:hypothetical protein
VPQGVRVRVPPGPLDLPCFPVFFAFSRESGATCQTLVVAVRHGLRRIVRRQSVMILSTTKREYICRWNIRHQVHRHSDHIVSDYQFSRIQLDRLHDLVQVVWNLHCAVGESGAFDAPFAEFFIEGFRVGGVIGNRGVRIFQNVAG